MPSFANGFLLRMPKPPSPEMVRLETEQVDRPGRHGQHLHQFCVRRTPSHLAIQAKHWPISALPASPFPPPSSCSTFRVLSIAPLRLFTLASNQPSLLPLFKNSRLSVRQAQTDQATALGLILAIATSKPLHSPPQCPFHFHEAVISGQLTQRLL